MHCCIHYIKRQNKVRLFDYYLNSSSETLRTFHQIRNVACVHVHTEMHFESLKTKLWGVWQFHPFCSQTVHHVVVCRLLIGWHLYMLMVIMWMETFLEMKAEVLFTLDLTLHIYRAKIQLDCSDYFSLWSKYCPDNHDKNSLYFLEYEVTWSIAVHKEVRVPL